MKINKDYIKEQILLGTSQVQLANKFGVSKQRISQICKDLGIKKENKVKQTKRDKLLELTGLSKDQLVEARLKFSRKKMNNKHQGKYEWTIKFEDIKWNTVCPILGIPLDYFSESICGASPSFDRIDNNKGYVAGNIQIVSCKANSIKRKYSMDELQMILDNYNNIC